MSLVGQQRGDTRRRLSVSIGAVMASIGLGMPGVQPNAVPTAGAPRSAVESPRALPPADRTARRVAKAERKSRGRPRDGRKARRRALMALFGVKNTGRQYEFVRRALREEAPLLLRMSVPELQRLTFLRSAPLEANRRAA